MRNLSDWELIQRYADGRSEPAFDELVRRHLAWVYSVAMRHVRQPQLAEEVAQSVFVLLARKATSLRPGTVVGGWLFRTTRFVGSRALRAEQRHKLREQTASSMSPTTPSEETEAAWERLAPHLDPAVAALSDPDRVAILLRFYEKKTLNEVGTRLGVSEEAAKKRVSRAVDKLRTLLAQRGVILAGAAVLTAVMSEKTVVAAPATLASSVMKAAGAGAAGMVLPRLAQETLRAWTWTKIKMGVGLATASMTLVLLSLNSSGWFTRHTVRQPLSNNNTFQADAGAIVTDQATAAAPAPVPAAGLQPFGKTGALTGVVLDDKSQPVIGAKVWGGFGHQPYAQDTTDASGRFALDKIGAPPLVTVTAAGFAADQQQFDPTNLPPQLVFRLSPVSPLLVRLVDEFGQGVPGVRLFLYQWWGRAGTLGQFLPQQTDVDGRLQWLSPPRGELELQFGKTGYRYSRTNKFAADGQEHTIVLRPAATVSGSVTDAETGATVSTFKFTAGHSQPWNPVDPTPLWDLQSRTGTNGFFSMSIDEEQRPFLRIEAESYVTVESQIQLTNELAVVQDFQLQRQNSANAIRGTVLLPDGTPAAGTEVALCTAQVGVMLSGTNFEPGAFGNVRGLQSADYRTKTDEHGSFSFALKPGAHTVVAVGAEGVGQVRCFNISKPLEIRLQPWGRIEGTVRTRDGLWANRKVAWSHSGNLTRWMTLFFAGEGFFTVSDADGKFTLEHVPPGDCRVSLHDNPGVASILSASLHVDPGQTAHVQVGGFGRPVVGQLVAPPGVAVRSWSNQVTAHLHVEFDSYQMPGELTGNAAERWKVEFEDTAAGRAWFREQRYYDFKVGADGSFMIPEVLPGKYHLFVNVAQGYLGSGPDSKPSGPDEPRIAAISKEVIVPEVSEGAAQPLDVGDVLLIADH